jgi:hypothetical protein
MSEPVSELPPNERGEQSAPEPAPQSHDWSRQTARRERTRHDPLGAITLAALLIMAGAIFMADNLGYLPRINNADAWDWIILGAGVVVLLISFLRAISPDVQGPSLFGIIAGLILLGLGLGAVFAVQFNLGQWWPAILIVLGISALARAVRG